MKLSHLITRKNVTQVLIYVTVGSLTAGIDLFLYWLLINTLHLWYLLAAAITNPIVLSFNFFNHRWFTFKSISDKRTQIPRYIGLVVFNYFVGLAILYIFVDLLGLNYLVGKVMTIAAVVSYNFFVLKFVIFSH